MRDPGPLHSGPLSMPIALLIQSNLERKKYIDQLGHKCDGPLSKCPVCQITIGHQGI